jgi:hypothetical protein
VIGFPIRGFPHRMQKQPRQPLPHILVCLWLGERMVGVLGNWEAGLVPLAGLCLRRAFPRRDWTGEAVVGKFRLAVLH